MSFLSPLFLAFFTLTAILYVLLPKACRPFVLLCAGIGFCLSWGLWMLLPLAGIILVSYLIALALSKTDSVRARKVFLALGWILLFGTLFTFKYASWAINGVSSLLSFLTGDADGFSFEWNVLLPVGISFYTLQAAG
ncbi:MAG: hypothetical protein J5843_05280, partial [Clostridia bacterium]|nr:hypothetical protein [Clostridia bacterium]